MINNSLLQQENRSSSGGRLFLAGKFLALLMLLFAFMGTMKAEEVTIGDLDGSVNNSFLPMNSLYDYSYSQQIYTADEIGIGGTINSITMWLYGSADLHTMSFDIYMMEVDKDVFESNTDWVVVSASDIVYTGSVTVHNTVADAYTFTLDTPFNYSGTNNLLIAFNNTSGQWKTGFNGMVNPTADGVERAIYARRDGTVYDPYNPTFTATGVLASRDVVTFDITPAGDDGELTVHNGTSTNSYVPLYGYWADAYNKCEMVYPAAELSNMTGGTISQLAFYASNTSVSWGSARFQVFMKEVSSSTISAYTGTSGATVVYEGTLNVANGMMVISFSTPYDYNGGNLLIGLYEISTGSYSSVDWYGEAVTGACVQGYNSSSLSSVSATQRNFLPKTTFTYVSTPSGPSFVTNPEQLYLELARPNGYWTEPFAFKIINTGSECTITSVVSSDPYFTVDVEVPVTLARNQSLAGTIATGSTENVNVTAQLAVSYTAEGFDPGTVYLDVAAVAYNAVTPDVWELAEDVTSFPYQSTVTTDNLYRNYNLPLASSDVKDAVYKVTLTEDVMLNAGADGDNPVTAVYTEDFNGFGGPGLYNCYEYYGPEVGPGPKNYWYSYSYTGSNTFYGTSTGGGMVFGYRISAAMLQELELGNCAITTIEAAAREGSYYDLIIMKGGEEPDFSNIVYYQEFSDYQPFYYFNLNLDEPQFLGDDENLWIMFYSDSPYAAYCGKTPVDVENARLWCCFDVANPSWSYSQTYTPIIYTRFLELSTGREVAVNLATMNIRDSKPAAGEFAAIDGTANGVSKGQMAQNNRGNRDDVEITFEMFDSWGDGWNDGAAIQVIVDGTDTEQITLADGSSGSQTISVPAGSHVTLTWIAGTYDNENSFTVSMNGEVIYTSGTLSEGLLFEFDVPGGTPTPPTPQGPDYQVENLYLPAGTYYVVTAAESDDFEVNIDIAEVPVPEQATVIDPYDGETGVHNPYLMTWELGNYTKEMQVLIGTQYPPTTAVIDWTTDLVAAALLPEVEHNRVYFLQVNERNDTGVTEGEIIAFTTVLDKVQGFTVDTPYIYIGDQAVLSWEAGSEDVIGYNLYLNGSKVNDELITETSYVLADLEYNNDLGYDFNVTAVYDAGESAFSNTVTVYVEGYGTVAGNVYEQDGVTPIADVAVTFSGFNEFSVPKSFVFQTDENGMYSGSVDVGTYIVTASLLGYQTVEYPYLISVSYEEVVDGIDFILDEMYYGVDTVMVAYNNPNVKVEWVDSNVQGDRSFVDYRIYRTAFDNDGPYSIYNTDLVAEVADVNSYVDENWENLEFGLYKYGVSRVYEGNRGDDITGFTENFDNGLPENWTMIDADGDGRCWMLGSAASLGFGHGHDGSNDMMISKSYENGGSVCPNNYLVTPEVQFTEFSQFSFWACAQDENYASEHFGVAVSVDGNQYASDFVQVYENTIGMRMNTPRNDRAQSQWTKYEVDLSQFAGQTGYIAIRHYNSCDNFYLDIDDVELFNADVQLVRESKIVWSEPIGKDMYLVDGEVNITVYLDSYDSPAGATVTFENVSEPEYSIDPITLDESGYYELDLIRRGDYLVTVAMEGYDTLTDYVQIWEPTSLEYMLGEIMIVPGSLNITKSGYVTWSEEATRHFSGMYQIQVLSGYDYVYIANTYDNFFQIPEEYLTDGMVYQVYVFKNYSSGYWSQSVVGTFRYFSCDNLLGADNIYAVAVEDGVYMSWDYPVYDNSATAQHEGQWICYDNGEYYGSMGLTNSAGMLWGMMIPAGTYNGDALTKIAAYDHVAMSSTVTIYNDLTDTPSNAIATMDIAFTGAGQYVEFEFAEPVALDPTQNVWIVLSNNTASVEHPVSLSYQNGSTTTYYNWYSNGTNWYAYSQDKAFMIRGYIESLEPVYHEVAGANIYYNGELVDFTTENNYTFEGEEYGNYDTYSIQVLYENHFHGCVQDAFYRNVYEVYVLDGDFWTYHMTNYVSNWNQYEGGSVIGTGEYLELDTCTLTAVPDPGYEFYYWYNMVTGEMVYNNETITFAVDADHTHFEANFKLYGQQRWFDQGWNWWSTYVEMSDIDGLAMLENGLSANGYMISSQSAFATNYGEYGWYGSLTSLNNESMYKVKMNEDDYAIVSGHLADPAEHPITLSTGWNWIGYVLSYSDDINNAFANIEPTAGDMIKSQYAYAQYYEGYGWYGSLNTISIGQGLMYKSMNEEPVTLVYGDVPERGELKANLTAENNYWVPDMNAYPSNMTIMAVVELNEAELQSDNYELAAFVNGECRGSVKLIYAEPIDRYVAFLTVAGEESAEMSFGLYNAQSGAVYYSGDNMTFNADAMVGNPGAPVIIRFEGNNNANGFMVYPNPVANGENITIVLSTETESAEAAVINALGEVVSVETLTQSQTSIALPSVSGVYTIRIITENNDTYFRKVVVK